MIIDNLVAIGLEAIAFAIAALGGAWLIRRVGLPDIVGMLVAGTLAGTFLIPYVSALTPAKYHVGRLMEFAPITRTTILSLILVEAGLRLAIHDLRASGTLALRFGLIPLSAEILCVSVAAFLMTTMPVALAFITGLVIAPVSPAIVIPGMLGLLRTRQSPRTRRIPAALLTGAPIDNISALVFFGAVLSLTVGDANQPWWRLLARVPLHVAGGVCLGIFLGLTLVRLFRLRYGHKTDHPQVVDQLLGLAGISACIALSKAAGLSTVLAALAFGMTLHHRAAAQRGTYAFSRSLAQIWPAARYILFTLIGFSIDLKRLGAAGPRALAIIVIGQIGRALGMWTATSGQRIFPRERAAAYLAYLPKATIQAALGAIPRDRGLPFSDFLLVVSALAITLTAPLGMIAEHRLVRTWLPSDDDIDSKRA